ncbi:tetratricopeptide repeat protein [Prosthecobacter sp.]|uniref:tetratricopeptide repeat protein n=1 Tax=Prosthecobacter sp. TaxID=1965333 RepID=UPI002486D4A4|nr:tetratricopeptide repeat protein [Prosthecobacter sp.]MDI1312512.1 tetratricopeptide repeat protein [Prosthecobacter sp.]
MSKRTRSKHPSGKNVTPSVTRPSVLNAPAPEALAPQLPESVKPSRASWFWVHAALVALLMGLCASLYVWTADFPMAFDDHTYLKDNPFFRGGNTFDYLKDFNEFVTRPLRMGSDPDYAVNAVLRPVAYASFRLNYKLDEFNPYSYRLINVAIHALNAILIYALVTVLLRRSTLAVKLQRSSVLFISAAAALLFAAHPLATESVTYIVQRFTSLVVLFSLLSLCLYFASFSMRSTWGRWLLRGVAVVALLLAMQTKEDAFMIPLVAVLLDWLVIGSRLRTAVIRALPLLLLMPLIPVLVFMTAAAQNGGFDFNAAMNIVNSRDAPLTHWQYFVTELTVMTHYLRQMFWPKGMNLDPEWPLYSSLLQGPVLLALAVLSGIVLTAWGLFRRFKGDVRFVLGFACVCWFFITISVSSGLTPLPDLVAEHRSYLPSIGIFILVACLLDWVRISSSGLRGKMLRVGIPVLTLLCVGALSWKTCIRNNVWRTRESLWEDTVAKSPGKYRTWGNLGAAYSDAGKNEQAVHCFREALKVEPRFQNGLLNLSNSLLRLNRPKEALDITLQLINIDKTATTKPPVAFTLGLSLAGVGRYDEAVSIFRDILTSIPEDPQTHKALGLVYFQTGLPHRALDHYQAAARIQPDDVQLQKLIQAAEVAMAEKRRPR